MIRTECKKIITFPVVFLIFCLCIMNVILIYYSEVRNTPYTGQNGYRQQWQLVSDMLVNEPPEQVYAQLQADYEKTFWTNSADSGSLRTAYVQARILKEMESIVQYDEYLENIRQSTDTGHSFSRFQETENRFTRENRKLTAAAYEKMSSVSLNPQPSLGIELFATSPITNLLVLFLLLFLQIIIWGRDKETGMNSLLHTCYNGRKRLALVKISVSFVCCVLVVSLLYGSTLLLAHNLYGTGDLTRSLSSVYLFRQTAWNISVRQFILLFLTYKILASFLYMLLFGIAVDVLHNTISAVVSSAGVVILCHFLYENGTDIVKYLLPGGLLHVENLITIYRNLNVFGFPFTYSSAASVVLAAGIAGCICVLTESQAEISVHLPNKLPLLPVKGPVLRTVNLWIHELWKLFFEEKVLLLLLLLAVAQFFISDRETVRYYDYTDFYYRQYMQYLSGEVTEEKKDFILSEKERFATLNRQKQNALLQGKTDYLAEQELYAYEAFELTEQYWEYITENDIGYMVYEPAVDELTAASTQRTDALLAFEAMLFTVLCSTLVFGRDYQLGTDKLCRITFYGKRKAPAIRMVIGMTVNLLILVLLYCPYYKATLKTYGVGTAGLYFPADCLRSLDRYGCSITLGTYFLLLSVIRFLFMNLTGLVVYAISQKLRSIIHTIILGCTLFMLPFGMIMLSVSLASLFFLYSPMLGNYLLTSPLAVVIIFVSAMLALTAWLVHLSVDVFCR